MSAWLGEPCVGVGKNPLRLLWIQRALGNNGASPIRVESEDVKVAAVDDRAHTTPRPFDACDAVGDGERRYKESNNNGEGWNPILVKIKDQIESVGQ